MFFSIFKIVSCTSRILWVLKLLILIQIDTIKKINTNMVGLYGKQYFGAWRLVLSSIHFALTNSRETSSHWFALFWTFLAGRQSKLTKKKLENSALNMFLVVNEPKEQEFSLKKSRDSGISLALARDFLQFSDF
jgi:hypothetical protein